MNLSYLQIKKKNDGGNNLLETISNQKQKTELLDKPELRNLRLLFGLNVFLMIVLYVMPQYFGIHIGWDITCTRLANILLTVYSLLHYRVFNLFSKTFVSCSITIPLIIYLFVAFYTMIFRVDINAFMMVFMEILTLYMLIFAIRYVIGIKLTLKIILGCAYFLSVYGFVEFAAGESLYVKFLKTMPAAVGSVYRSGYYRIMGPCGHALGYGLLLILFVAITCFDYEKNEIYIYRRPLLLLMLITNTFLTGSRSSLALVIIEIVLIFIISDNAKKKKTFFYSIVLLISIVAFLVVAHDTKIGRYILMQLTTLVDQLLGTDIAPEFGADVSRLQDSENYREYLPQIFTLDWLNPFIGRGVKRAFSATLITEEGAKINIHSVDSYYICQYLKYAYPGLIAYCSFLVTLFVTMIKGTIKYKSNLMKVLLIAIGCYFINLWWVDALQTLKFVYVYVAVFFALLLYYNDFSRKEGT